MILSHNSLMYFKPSIFSKFLNVFNHKHQFLYYSNNYNTLKPPWRVVFFGTDNFSLASLQALHREYKKHYLLERLEVVTTPKTNPVRNYAVQEGLKIHDWPLNMAIDNSSFHIGLVVSFGHLLPSSVINVFPMGVLNVHASLLPRWRGAAPIIYAIANGDKKTGVTIMKIKPEKFDIGEIVRQDKANIPSDIKMPELYHKLAALGAQTLIQSLKDLPKNLENAIPQTNEGVTFAPKVKLSLASIDFTKQSSTEIYNLGRALTGMFPLATTWNGISVKLHNITICTNPQSAKAHPGFAVFDKANNVINIHCSEGWISANKFGVLNKKIMNAREFNNGYLKKQPVENRIFR